VDHLKGANTRLGLKHSSLPRKPVSYGPRAQLYKTFLSKVKDFRNQVFAPAKPLQPILMFESKPGAYPSEASFRCSTLGQASDLTSKDWTKLERFAEAKCPSLLRTFIIYGQKCFYYIGSIA
jgi:hypothetical protein